MPPSCGDKFRNRPQLFATLVNIAMAWVQPEQQNSDQAFCLTEAPTMTTLNVIDPSQMTLLERRAEVASILALGLVRLRTHPAATTEKEKKKELGFCPPKSVHTNPASTVRMAIRKTLQAQQKEFE